MEQLQIDDERYIVKLDSFEGPLDLLLHLIRKHELEIFDIPISFITKKYLEYIDAMKTMNLDLAAGYLDMAATLALIKSRMMLPAEPNDDDDELEDFGDPREELVRRLLEYQKYKTAADELSDRPMLGRDTFPRGETENVSVERGLSSPGLFSLIEAFQKVLDRTNEKPVHEVEVTRVSITARIHQLVDILRTRKSISFTELFEGIQTRSDMVVTFLSLLELTKLGLSKIHQAGAHTEIHITAAANINDAGETLSNLPEEP